LDDLATRVYSVLSWSRDPGPPVILGSDAMLSMQRMLSCLYTAAERGAVELFLCSCRAERRDERVSARACKSETALLCWGRERSRVYR